MESMGIVEVIGKRQCLVTNKTVAVYKVKDDVYQSIKERLQ
jgi:hypothetical protein